jgi:hypothetical protein
MIMMMKNSLYPLLWMDNPANNNFSVFSFAEMNRMATWKH